MASNTIVKRSVWCQSNSEITKTQTTFPLIQELSPIYMRYLFIISLFTAIFSVANKLEASDIEKKFRQIERSWIEKYGQSHPFAEFEKLAANQIMSDEDLKEFRCKKQSLISGSYSCANGITVKGRKISKVSACRPSPFNMVQILEKNGIPRDYASLMFASMERNWNSRAKYFSYKITNTKMCVKARF